MKRILLAISLLLAAWPASAYDEIRGVGVDMNTGTNLAQPPNLWQIWAATDPNFSNAVVLVSPAASGGVTAATVTNIVNGQTNGLATTNYVIAATNGLASPLSSFYTTNTFDLAGAGAAAAKLATNAGNIVFTNGTLLSLIHI